MIDLNRGVTKRGHPSGVQVCMYKDDPGVYLDTSGNPIAEQIAREAGFPVEKYAVERKRRQAVAEAMKQINEEFGNIALNEVVYRVGNYAVAHVGNGQFALKDNDGAVLSAAMDKASAVKLAKKMAAAEEAEVEVARQEAAKKAEAERAAEVKKSTIKKKEPDNDGAQA